MLTFGDLNSSSNDAHLLAFDGQQSPNFNIMIVIMALTLRQTLLVLVF